MQTNSVVMEFVSMKNESIVGKLLPRNVYISVGVAALKGAVSVLEEEKKAEEKIREEKKEEEKKEEEKTGEEKKEEEKKAEEKITKENIAAAGEIGEAQKRALEKMCVILDDLFMHDEAQQITVEVKFSDTCKMNAMPYTKTLNEDRAKALMHTKTWLRSMFIAQAHIRQLGGPFSVTMSIKADETVDLKLKVDF